jgi:UDP-galactopyranose mutase
VEREGLVVWIDNPRMLPVVPVDPSVTLVCDLANPMATGASLLSRADLLLTDGSGGYQASRHLHPRAYLFPHAADVDHFSAARRQHQDPPEQAGIPYPRVGFWGTINDRIDFGLLDAVAARLPRVQFMMVGAVERAGRERMTARANVHWLGERPYADLPAYIAGWDAAMLPFARNDLTRFLSPPQIPEYLAAGRPVVSTGLPDVVHPYGASGLVRIAETADDFATAVDGACRGRSAEWLATVDRYLKALSWQSSWAGIEHLINAVIEQRSAPAPVERRVRRMSSIMPVPVMH